MHKFGTNPWKLSFKNISLDALVLKEYDIFGLLHIYIYILATEYGNHFRFWSGPQKVGSRLFDNQPIPFNKKKITASKLVADLELVT